MLIALSLLSPALFCAVLVASGFGPRRVGKPVRNVVCALSPAAVVPAVFLALVGDGVALDLPWMLFGSRLQVDGVARPLLLIAAILYGAALIALSWRRSPDRENRNAVLVGFLLASYLGNIGVYLAADVASFYLWFAIMSFSAVGLIIHYRTAKARRATVFYLVMSVLSETALLVGFLTLVASGAHLIDEVEGAWADSDVATITMVALLIGFGIKAGLVPLHVWLPLAHPAAPPAASAVLSGAMVKAGLVGWLRFFPPVETVDQISVAGWILVALGLLGAFGGALVGVLHNDPKVVLAYSTVSQMGFITATVGVSLIRPDLAPAVTAAALLYAVHHGLAKGTLFLAVPVLQKMRAGVSLTATCLATLGAALAVVGLPFTSGSFAKYSSKYAVDEFTLVGIGMDTWLTIVAVGSAALLLRLGYILWTDESDRDLAPDGQLLAVLITALAGATLPWWIGRNWLGESWPSLGLPTIWPMIWPAAAGLILGAILIKARVPAPPAGDVGTAAEHAVEAMVPRGGNLLNTTHERTHSIGERLIAMARRAGESTNAVIEGGELRWRGWQVSGVAVLLVMGLILTVMIVSGGWLR
ncbi:complex I subunit 5 family protein [Corynebacterium sputi]|uniref:complex I subunit 5 family protein n=1 Tax=Corynebacterium sputi TaxID=489915 RepID=UPI0003F7DA8C|nr:proton-conducting transporter membrane subunit [Corynebacterium sputi]